MSPKGSKKRAAPRPVREMSDADSDGDLDDDDDDEEVCEPVREKKARRQQNALSSAPASCLRCRAPASTTPWAAYNSVRTSSGSQQAPRGPACARCEQFRLKYFPYVTFETMCDSPGEMAEAEASENCAAKNFKEEEVSSCVQHTIEVSRPYLALTEKDLKTIGDIQRVSKSSVDNLSHVVLPMVGESGEVTMEKHFLFAKTVADPPWAPTVYLKTSILSSQRTMFMKPDCHGWEKQGTFSMQNARSNMIEGTGGASDFVARDSKNITTLAAWVKTKLKKTLATGGPNSEHFVAMSSPVASSGHADGSPPAHGNDMHNTGNLASSSRPSGYAVALEPPSTPTPRKGSGGVASLVQLSSAASSTARSMTSASRKPIGSTRTGSAKKLSHMQDDPLSGGESPRTEATGFSDDGDLPPPPGMAGDLCTHALRSRSDPHSKISTTQGPQWASESPQCMRLCCP